MRRAALALLFAFTPFSAFAIIGGAGAPNEIAAQTVLIVSTRGASCSGTVLARQLVLTAAHCVAPQADYAVALVEGASPRLLQVASVILHPGFDPAQFKTRRPTPDLALLKLAEPLPARYRAARLSTEAALPRPGDQFVLAGFGIAAEGNDRSAGTLRTLALPAVGTTGGHHGAAFARRGDAGRRLHRRFRRAGVQERRARRGDRLDHGAQGPGLRPGHRRHAGGDPAPVDRKHRERAR